MVLARCSVSAPLPSSLPQRPELPRDLPDPPYISLSLALSLSPRHYANHAPSSVPSAPRQSAPVVSVPAGAGSRFLGGQERRELVQVDERYGRERSAECYYFRGKGATLPSLVTRSPGRRLTRTSDPIAPFRTSSRAAMAGRTGALEVSSQMRSPAPNAAKRHLWRQQQEGEADFNDKKVIASTCFSIGASLALACFAVSLLVLPLVLPPLPPPPSQLLWLPVCLLVLLVVVAFVPADVRSMASSYL